MRRALQTLVEFSRALSGVDSRGRIVELLARGAIEHLGATAAAVLAVSERGRAELVSSQNLPQLEGFSIEPEAILPTLAGRLAQDHGLRRDRIHLLPLVAEAELLGACVVVRDPAELEDWQVEVAEAMADLTAAALRKERSLAHVRRADEKLSRVRESLARTERLQLLGQMSAGIAHDLRNLFNPLALQLELLRRNRDRLATLMDALDSSVKRGLDTVDRLRQFSRPPSDRRAQVSDLDILVKEAGEICAPRLNAGVASTELRLELESPPRVFIEQADFVSAVINLVTNAADAMPDGGTITIRTGVGPGAWVQVRDNGPGVPVEIQSQIFEPFFTTKGMNGTGLGLATVQAFVERQGGRIALVSAPGAGAAFTMSFPLAAGEQLSSAH